MSNAKRVAAVPEQTRQKLARGALGLACGALLLISSPAAADWIKITLPKNDSQLQLRVALETDTSPRGALPTAVSRDLLPAEIGTGMVTGAPNIQVEMGLRSAKKKAQTSTTATGTLMVQARNCAPEIPVADFGWLSSALPKGPAGTVWISSLASLAGAAAGPMTVASITSIDGAEAWLGGLLTFTLANTTIYPAGTFTCTFEFTAALQ